MQVPALLRLERLRFRCKLIIQRLASSRNTSVWFVSENSRKGSIFGTASFNSSTKDEQARGDVSPLAGINIGGFFQTPLKTHVLVHCSSTPKTLSISKFLNTLLVTSDNQLMQNSSPFKPIPKCYARLPPWLQLEAQTEERVNASTIICKRYPSLPRDGR
jgi:hypothetical protein